MDLALNEPEHGYYGTGRARIGTQGDFVTFPSLGSDFAALLAPQLQGWLTELSTSDPDQRLAIVEIGPGEGHLAKDLISQLRGADPALLARIDMVLVEANAGMRQRQQDLLKHVDNLSVRWCSLEELQRSPVRGVLIAHELLDALPVERLSWRMVPSSSSGWNWIQTAACGRRIGPARCLTGQDQPCEQEPWHPAASARCRGGLDDRVEQCFAGLVRRSDRRCRCRRAACD